MGMKPAKVLLSTAALIVLLALSAEYKSHQGATVSNAPSNDGYEATDRLPSSRPLGWHNLPTTNDVPEKDTYLGGRLYARPDGEIFTALGDVDPIPDAKTSRNIPSHYSVGRASKPANS